MYYEYKLTEIEKKAEKCIRNIQRIGQNMTQTSSEKKQKRYKSVKIASSKN